METASEGLEGYFQPMFPRQSQQVLNPNAKSAPQADYQIVVDRTGKFDATSGVYDAPIERYAKEGFYIKITHKRHPRLGRLWLRADEILYRITAVIDTDQKGLSWTLFLAEGNNG
jgi:hypothetical protein